MRTPWLFTGKSKPPKCEKELEDMTYNELHEEFKRCRERAIQLHDKIREIDMAAGAWFVNGPCKN